MSQTKAQLIDNLVSPITGALGSASAPTFSFTADPNTGIYSPGADQLAVTTGGTGRLFIDSSGRLLAGTSTARSNFFGTTLSSITQVEGTGGAGGRGALSVINNDVSNNPPYVLLGRSGAATLGSNAVVVNGSRLGTLTFHGADGTSFIEAATVAGEVDGTPGANDMPGRLVFSTTADGAASPTERLRITSTGLVGIGTSAPADKLHVVTSGGKSAILIGDNAASSYSQVLMYGGSTKYNWSIGAQFNVNNALEITPSTATDGTSFTTPVAVFTQAGRVGIGTTSPGSAFDVNGAITARGDGSQVALYLGAGSQSIRDLGTASTTYLDLATGSASHGQFIVRSSNAYTERARIDSSGRLLVGTSSSSAPTSAVFQGNSNSSSGSSLIYLQSGSAASSISSGIEVGRIRFADNAGGQYAEIMAVADAAGGTNDYPGRLVFSTTADGAASPTERMRIDNVGNLVVNDSAGVKYSAKAYVNGSIAARNGGADGGYQDAFIAGYNANSNEKNIIRTAVSTTAGSSGFQFMVSDGAGLSTVTESFRINRTACNVSGSLSKGSGSFKIDHPLLEKKNTHHLVHSFIEGPQADLIYRGHVDLINGKATINIDEVARMTEGTFNALCTNVCCFTSNESDWTSVRGSVSGNILTIEAQDLTSTAEVCWMVIGERRDQHMLDTDWTDENGRVITEPLKEVAASQPY